MTGVGIGLDIGTSAVKLVELLGGKEIRVNRLGMAPLPNGLVSAGEIKNPEEVGAAIKSLVQKHNIQSKRIVIAVAGQAVTVRHLKLALQNKKELADTVRKEIEKSLPYTLDELYMDFQVITTEQQQKIVEVVVVCAHKAIIDSHLEVMRYTGLTPVAIDIQPFALVRAAGFENLKTNENICLLDIGEETSDLMILRDGVPLFTRVIQLAGSRITQLIGESIGIPYTSADELKRVYSDIFRDLSQISIDDIDYKVNLMVQKGMKELVTELKRSFEYFYLQQQDEAELSKLIVSGGGSKLKNLFPYLNHELKIKVIPCPQPENVICPSASLVEFDESLPIYNVALGLALREVTEG